MELAIINRKIYTVRSVKIMLDRDLAELYEVETRVLNQSVKRNKELFPSDFMFQLTKEEYENMSSQIVMTSKTKRPNSALPFAFTEHGVAMLSNVLKSIKARLISVEIVRAFIALKKFTLSNQELIIRLNEIEIKYNQKFSDIHQALNYLIQKDKKLITQKEREKIGFKFGAFVLTRSFTNKYNNSKKVKKKKK
jgi:hypothetical protein